MAGLLDVLSEAYMRNVGNPARQLVGNGVRGLLGLDPADYADTLGMEAYRNAQALSMAPTPLAFAAVPAAMVRGAKSTNNAADVARGLNAMKSKTELSFGSLVPQGTNVRDAAESFAKRLKDLGFQVSVEHSGSQLGPSSYMRIYDPVVEWPVLATSLPDIRVSGHSKGPYNNQFVYGLGTEQDFNELLSFLNAQRTPERIASAEKARAERTAQQAMEAQERKQMLLRSAEKKVSKGKSLTRSEQEVWDAERNGGLLAP